jgi:hypothetical protein
MNCSIKTIVRRGPGGLDAPVAALGLPVQDAVGGEDDCTFRQWLARYCARNPVALDRLTYDAQRKRVVYRSDKLEGPTAGAETVDPLEFLTRVLTHIPDKGQVMTRYYGWYANRVRGRRWQAAVAPPVPIAPAQPITRTEARRRWAELLRQIFEVDPLTRPSCGGPMGILAFVTQAPVIAQIIRHLRTRPPADLAAKIPTQ